MAEVAPNIINVERGDNPLVCDMCASTQREVVYEYRTTGDYRMDNRGVTIEVKDDGRWATCALCTYLIETHQPGVLMEAAMDNMIAGRSIWPAPQDGMRRGIAKSHSFFWSHKLPGRLRVIDDNRSEPVTDAEMAENLKDLAALLGLD